MKKALVGVAALTFLAVLVFVIYAANLIRSLQTPEFKARVAKEASAALGAQVQFQALDVSLLRGIRLDRVRIQNPPGFGGDLVAVENATLSYDPWSLLLGRIHVDELSLRKPVIGLATDARGVFNYAKLAALAPTERTTAPTVSSMSLLRLVVSKLSVKGARFAVVDEKKAAVLRLDDADLEAALAMESGVLTGTGKASIDSFVLANAVFLRDVRAPLKLTKQRMILAPLQARLAGGAVSGEIRVDFEPGMRYTLQTAASGANVATLIKEAGSSGSLTGTLNAKAKIEGTGGVLTIKGAGDAEIKDCRWPRAALFGVLASALRIPELSEPRFDECRIEFTLGSGQARNPVVRFKGPAIELTGQGVTSLVTSSIDYDLTLALSPSLLAKAPGMMRAAFMVRSDGFGTIPFKVTGTAAAPKTDLARRFGKSVAIEAAKKGLLDRFFGPKKKPQ